MPHRVKIVDMAFILMVLLAVSLFAFEVDFILYQAHANQHERAIELDELLILTTLVVSGALFYTWRRALEHKRDCEARIVAESEALRLALHDPLTGLPNRRQFDRALTAALEAVPAAPEAHAILLFDLNGFKKINDGHGHPIGDQVLINVGRRLLGAAREGDLVARLGGDEFVVLARNLANADGAASLGLRILESLAKPVAISGFRHRVSAAIGIALTPHDGVTAEELLRKADVALYRAKSEKSSGFLLFEEAMDRRPRECDGLERVPLEVRILK